MRPTCGPDRRVPLPYRDHVDDRTTPSCRQPLALHSPQRLVPEVSTVLLVARPEPVPLATDEDGVVRAAESRVTLDALVHAFDAGATAEEIAQQYPSVSLDDVYAVVTYYLRQRSQVEDYLKTRDAESEQTRRDNESRHDPAGIRERLLARRHA